MVQDNKMGKTDDLFKKIGAIKGKFHSRVGMMDRNGKDVKETEQTKKRWKGYTEKLYQKKTQKTTTRNLNDPYNHKAWSLT